MQYNSTALAKAKQVLCLRTNAIQKTRPAGGMPCLLRLASLIRLSVGLLPTGMESSSVGSWLASPPPPFFFSSRLLGPHSSLGLWRIRGKPHPAGSRPHLGPSNMVEGGLVACTHSNINGVCHP